MKNNWTTRKLGEVCEISTGKSNANEAVEDGEYAFFDRSKTIKRSTRFLFDCEAIIIPGEGQEFFPKYYKGKFDLHQRAYALYNFNEKVNIQFIYKYLIHFHKYFENVAVGATAKSLRLRHFEELPFPLPPLSEQKQIVRILDEIFGKTVMVKENVENNLQNARELFESYLQNIFANLGEGWEEKTLGDSSIIEIIDGDRGVKYPKKSDFLEKGHCLFLNTKNVRPDGFCFDTTMFITKEKDAALRKGKLIRNDVILTTRGTIGNLAVYDSEVPYDNIRINSGMLIFRPNMKKLLPSFLFEVLRSGIIKTQIVRHVSGAAQPQLPIKTLVNFKISVPRTVDAQAKIVSSLKEMAANTKRLEVIYQQKLTDLEELKKSILQKAFNGELAGVCS
ncbi:MAG: restriction endonuclease subunit S [Candidatus Omnitrophota bacterium]